MSSYNYYVEDPTNIVTNTARLEDRINRDFDITTALDSPPTSYNGVTQILTINFVSTPSEDELVVLTRLVEATVFEKTVGIDIQAKFYNKLPRDSVYATGNPTEFHDAASYYVPGSKVINIVTNDVWFCIDNAIDNAIWIKNIGSVQIEGSTGPIGSISSGPVVLGDNDKIRYWSENLVIDVQQGVTGPAIQIDTPSPIGGAFGLGELYWRFQQGQGANWRPYVEFTNVATNPTPQSGGFIEYKGTDFIGVLPTQGFLLHNGLYKGGAAFYRTTIKLEDRTNNITIFSYTWDSNPGGTNLNWALPQRADITSVGTWPTGPALLELTIQNNIGDYTRLYVLDIV